MKTNKLFMLSIITSILIISQINTYAAPVLNSFIAANSQNSQIGVYENAPSYVTFYIDFGRGMTPGGNSEYFNVSYEFIYKKNDGTKETISPKFNIEYIEGQGPIWSVSRSNTITIPAGYIGGYVHLKYTYIHPFTNSAITEESETRFETILVPYNPQYYNSYEDGKLIRNVNNHKVYLGIGGKYRHIYDGQVVADLFRYLPSYTNIYNDINPSILGEPIGQYKDNNNWGAFIAKNYDNKNYFVEFVRTSPHLVVNPEYHIKEIPNSIILNKYKFSLHKSVLKTKWWYSAPFNFPNLPVPDVYENIDFRKPHRFLIFNLGPLD